MAFKINISDKGKSFQSEIEAESLIGKKIGDKIDGKEVKSELAGYELEITGTSDKAGFPGKKDVEGSALKKVLLTRGFAMKKRQRREGKGKIRRMPKGLRQRRTVRGNTISKDSVQINMRVIKTGERKLEEIFPKKTDEKSGEGESGEGKVLEQKQEPQKENTNNSQEGEKKE